MEWCIEISAAAYINIPGKNPYNFRFYINSGRHHRGGLWIFVGQKELLRKNVYSENELDTNFHEMWFTF